jgi:hypothetical protein
MQCMEIIGGNRAERRTISAPGLDIWIDSRPLAPGKGGGDVHYVSTCGAGYVTRLALADIAGHGESVDSLAIALRKLMRKYVNTLDQTRFAQAPPVRKAPLRPWQFPDARSTFRVPTKRLSSRHENRASQNV